MNDEEKKIIEKFIEKCNKFDESVEIKGISVGEEYRILETVCKTLDLVEKLQKENEEYSKQLDLDYVDKNYIPKQKIKAKIEELNKTINKDGIIYSSKQCARCQKDVLEELLIEESED